MCDNDESNHVAINSRQLQLNKETDTHISVSRGSTVAIKHKDGEPWTYRTTIKHRSEDHKGRCYKLRVMKTGHIITRNK